MLDYVDIAKIAEDHLEALLNACTPKDYIDHWWFIELKANGIEPLSYDAAYTAYQNLCSEERERVKPMALKMVQVFREKEPPYTSFCFEDALVILAGYGWRWPEFGNTKPA